MRRSPGDLIRDFECSRRDGHLSSGFARSQSATLLPIPLEAPVTRAFLPSRRNKSNTFMVYELPPGSYRRNCNAVCIVRARRSTADFRHVAASQFLRHDLLGGDDAAGALRRQHHLGLATRSSRSTQLAYIESDEVV